MPVAAGTYRSSPRPPSSRPGSCASAPDARRRWHAVRINHRRRPGAASKPPAMAVQGAQAPLVRFALPFSACRPRRAARGRRPASDPASTFIRLRAESSLRFSACDPGRAPLHAASRGCCPQRGARPATATPGGPFGGAFTLRRRSGPACVKPSRGLVGTHMGVPTALMGFQTILFQACGCRAAALRPRRAARRPGLVTCAGHRPRRAANFRSRHPPIRP